MTTSQHVKNTNDLLTIRQFIIIMDSFFARPQHFVDCLRGQLKILQTSTVVLLFLHTAANMFLAVYMDKAGLPEWSVWILVSFVCWHVLVEITLAIHMHWLKNSMKIGQFNGESLAQLT